MQSRRFLLKYFYRPFAFSLIERGPTLPLTLLENMKQSENNFQLKVDCVRG